MSYKIALIGYGYWGTRLLPYLEERFEVARVFGRSLERVGIFTNRLEDALGDEIDAVVIATPIDTHYEITRRALEAGKHVLCEKPLAQRSVKAKTLAEIAKRKKLILMTEFTYTFSEGLNLVKTVIDDHDIGTLLAIEFSLRYVGRFLKFNVYWLLASHMLSVLDMFTPLDGLTFKRTDLIRGETGVISFDGRVRGQIFVSINYPHRDSRIIFYGTRGTLKYSALEQPTVSLIRYGRTAGVLADKLITGRDEFQFDESNNLRNAANHFADALETSDLCRGNLERSLRVTSVLEAIEKE